MEIRKNKRERKAYIKSEIKAIEAQWFYTWYDRERLYLLYREWQK